MNRKSALAAVLAATLAAAMSFSATAAEAGGQYSGEQKYVEERLDNLTLGPSTGTVTFPRGSSGSGAAVAKVTDADLAAYADGIFELVNREREQAGAEPLERSDYLDEAANTRAMDCASVNSIRVDGQPHTRPDGSQWFTVLGVDENRNYGENTGQGRATAAEQMKSWMDSQGHRTNILYDRYTEIGIGCAVSEQGDIFAVQIFYRP